MWKVTYFKSGVGVTNVVASDLMDLQNQLSYQGISYWEIISIERIAEGN